MQSIYYCIMYNICFQFSLILYILININKNNPQIKQTYLILLVTEFTNYL